MCRLVLQRRVVHSHSRSSMILTETFYRYPSLAIRFVLFFTLLTTMIYKRTETLRGRSLVDRYIKMINTENYDFWLRSFNMSPHKFQFIFNSPYPMMTVFVLSRATLVITITAGVIQAKILYFTSAFLLSSWRGRAFPTCIWWKKKMKN